MYFYSNKYKINKNRISNIESFESTLNKINNQNNYYLEDSSLELLLDDYNKLKDNNM
jgi:hypothetical protein